MKKLMSVVMVCTMVSMGIMPVLHAQTVIYPAKGQSEAKMEKDKGECHTWAVKNTGVDPVAVAQQPTSSGSQPKGDVARGAARGAAVGATAGAIAGDAGTGAAAGAAAGAVAGGIRRRRGRRQQQEQQQQAEQQKSASMGQYNKAYGACLEGRGYSVK